MYKKYLVYTSLYSVRQTCCGRNFATVPHCRKCFFGGAENEGQMPEEIFKFRVSEMPFPGLWERYDKILMVRKQRFSMSKFAICFEMSSTKWAKAYLINYMLDKLQESMGNIFILCSLSWIM
jgi:hypothetical protein